MHGLVPLPMSVLPGVGRVPFGQGLSLSAPLEFARERGVVANWLANAAALSPGQERSGASSQATPGITLIMDPSIRTPEAYELVIRTDGIRLRSGDGAGILRGGSVLYQLALSEGSGLPCLEISDAPRFPWRGFMLDTARSFYRVEFLERLLDLAALHRLNVFHWHLSDDQAWRLDVPGMPELAGSGSRRRDRRYNAVRYREGCYGEADVRRVVAYAAARHIEVVPEIDVPGHGTALLASHPELWCHADHSDRHFEPEDRFGVFDGILCAGDDRSFGLLDRVFEYMSRVFPSAYVHAGGDEVPKAAWLSCDRCRARMVREGLRDSGGALDPDRLQAWFMDRIAGGLAALGKRMAGWDEMVDGGCTRDSLVFAWRSPGHGFRAAARGYEVVMCPQTKACYLDHRHLDEFEEPGQPGVCTVRDAYSFDPAPADLPGESRARIRGGQANLWGELVYFGRQAEYMLFPRLAAIAEALWTPRELVDFADFSARLAVHGRRLDALGVNRYRGALE